MKGKLFFSFLILFVISNKILSQAITDNYLVNILKENNDPLFQKILASPINYRLQIVYTQINRDKNNKPHFKNYYYNYNPKLYYNPASVVKLPLAALALEKLNKINKPGVNKYTTILFDSSQPKQKTLFQDTTALNNLPTIAQFIRKAFLISDNDAYNRLYQFVTQNTIHKQLWAKGYKHLIIPRQFMGFSYTGNRYSNPIRFENDAGQLIYTQPQTFNKDSLVFGDDIWVGDNHWTNQDVLIKGPMNFKGQNNISILDLQQILQSIMFPKSVPKKQRFQLTKNDYAFLHKFLSQYPSETDYPKYDTDEFYDSYVKFFFQDSTKKIPENIRVFNKVGWSYGFLTDVSYVADFKNNIEYMLTATIYANSDGVINDGKYDYETIGHPFLKSLGNSVYQYELNRKRDFLPNLSEFKLKYDVRDANDKRKPVKEVDN